jgi:protease II
LQQTLYDEFLSHMKETDVEVPYKHGPYLYYSRYASRAGRQPRSDATVLIPFASGCDRTQKGLAYKIHCRKSIATEEDVVILDVNKVRLSQHGNMRGSRPHMFTSNCFCYAAML